MGKAASCAWLAVLMCGPLALAQEKEASPPGGEEAAPPPAKEASPPGAENPVAAPPENPVGEAPKEGDVVTPTEQVGTGAANYSDIIVAPRIKYLKRRRLEIIPTYNVTMNSPMLRHHGLGAALNYYITEVLYLGLEGTYYRRQTLDRYFLVGLDQRVLPSVNQYDWSAMLYFGYVPIRGKFTLFNKVTAHWDTYVQGGAGIIRTEVIPRNPADNGFSNYDIAGVVGLGTRLWFNRWFAFDAYIKDYLFADKLEPLTRTAGDCVSSSDCAAAKNADSQFTNNLVFGVGFSFFLPAGFEYKQPR